MTILTWFYIIYPIGFCLYIYGFLFHTERFVPQLRELELTPKQELAFLLYYCFGWPIGLLSGIYNWIIGMIVMKWIINQDES